jgi:hypothetical protein
LVYDEVGMKKVFFTTEVALKFYTVQIKEDIGWNSFIDAKEEWCDNHKSKVKFFWFFERDARYVYSYYYSTWYFEKEVDRNWFMMRWG